MTHGDLGGQTLETDAQASALIAAVETQGEGETAPTDTIGAEQVRAFETATLEAVAASVNPGPDRKAEERQEQIRAQLGVTNEDAADSLNEAGQLGVESGADNVAAADDDVEKAEVGERELPVYSSDLTEREATVLFLGRNLEREAEQRNNNRPRWKKFLNVGEVDEARLRQQELGEATKTKGRLLDMAKDLANDKRLKNDPIDNVVNHSALEQINIDPNTIEHLDSMLWAAVAKVEKSKRPLRVNSGNVHFYVLPGDTAVIAEKKLARARLATKFPLFFQKN